MHTYSTSSSRTRSRFDLFDHRYITESYEFQMDRWYLLPDSLFHIMVWWRKQITPNTIIRVLKKFTTSTQTSKGNWFSCLASCGRVLLVSGGQMLSGCARFMTLKSILYNSWIQRDAAGWLIRISICVYTFFSFWTGEKSLLQHPATRFASSSPSNGIWPFRVNKWRNGTAMVHRT